MDIYQKYIPIDKNRLISPLSDLMAPKWYSEFGILGRTLIKLRILHEPPRLPPTCEVRSTLPRFLSWPSVLPPSLRRSEPRRCICIPAFVPKLTRMPGQRGKPAASLQPGHRYPRVAAPSPRAGLTLRRARTPLQMLAAIEPRAPQPEGVAVTGCSSQRSTQAV